MCLPIPPSWPEVSFGILRDTKTNVILYEKNIRLHTCSFKIPNKELGGEIDLQLANVFAQSRRTEMIGK